MCARSLTFSTEPLDSGSGETPVNQQQLQWTSLQLSAATAAHPSPPPLDTAAAPPSVTSILLLPGAFTHCTNISNINMQIARWVQMSACGPREARLVRVSQSSNSCISSRCPVFPGSFQGGFRWFFELVSGFRLVLGFFF